ncbi:tetratricopeptide repeat protein [Patescibacteria group bacterium]|nr:tetratricopeptide repeat protein [Patescibacteria group bacterium]
MIQPYLILAAGSGITGIFFRRKRLNVLAKQMQRKFEREQQKLNCESRSENLLRAQISLEEKSRKIQESLGQISVLMRKSDTHFAREEWRETEKILIQILSLDEHNLKANHFLGLTYLHREEWKRAELIFQKLIELEPKEASHFGNLGLAFYRQRKYPLAREAYENAIRIDGQKASRWLSLGQIYLKLKDFGAAAEAFKNAVKRDHRNLDYLFALAEAYEAGKNLKAAVKTFERILELSPYNDEVKQKLKTLEPKI